MVKYAWGISVIDADHDKDLAIIIFSDLDGGGGQRQKQCILVMWSRIGSDNLSFILIIHL